MYFICSKINVRIVARKNPAMFYTNDRAFMEIFHREVVITSLPEVASEVFGFDASTQTYSIADSVQIGHGYWIFVTDTIELEITNPINM